MENWKENWRGPDLVKNTKYSKLPSHFEKLPKGCTVVIGHGTKEVYFNEITVCPHFEDPMGSLKGSFPPYDKIRAQT